MLHKIELPDCAEHLRWIVALQRCLLKAVCHPKIAGSDIDIPWVTEQLAAFELDEQWLERFCRRRDRIRGSQRRLIEHLQTLADYPPDVKRRVLDSFNNDHGCLDEFDPSRRRLMGVSELERTHAAVDLLSLRALLESFYDPNFYKQSGYVIEHPHGDRVRFHRDVYIAAYEEKNDDVRVCPYCDGDLGSPEVDHFYPKSKFPQLSCHPLNLIPVCSTCNSRSNKGEKIPLDLDATDPTHDWFHPFLRSACDNFDIRFERVGQETQPTLRSCDVQTQRRLDNLNELVGIQARWRRALSRKIRATQRRLHSHFRRRHMPISEPSVCEKLNEWAEGAPCDIGLEPFAILGNSYLNGAARQDPALFTELWDYINGNDPVN